MKLVFSAKVFSARGQFYIHDENGKLKYNIVGHAFWHSDFSVCDADGRELIRVTDKVWSIRSRIKISVGGVQTAEIVGRFSWKTKLDIESFGWYVEASNALGKEYSITKNGRELAHISNKVWSLTDKMEVEIFDAEQELNIIGVVIAIAIINRNAATAAACS